MKICHVLPVLTFVAATEVTPRFGPARGLELHKTFEVTTTLDFEELTSVFNGADVPPEYLPEMDMHFETSHALVVHDRYEAVEDGLPKRLERRYAEIEEVLDMSVRVEGIVEEAGEYEGETELLGKEVVFDWEGDEASARFADGDGDVALLEGLRADMDFCGFLPSGDVEIGDEWDLAADLFEALTRPGGDLSVEGVTDPSEEPAEPPIFRGSWRARIVAEEGDLVRIALRGDIEEAWSYATDLEEIPVADGTGTETRTLAYEIEGELVWNRKAGHVHAVKAGGELVSTIVTRKDAGQPGPDFESTIVLAGTWSAEVGVEAAP